MSDFSRESMLDMFIYEMNQLLEQLEQLIIQGDAGYSMEDINEIFRIMHTIKGSAAMMMYDNVSKTAHAMEDLFFFLREEEPSDVDYSTLTDLILEGTDFIKNDLAKISEGEELDTDPSLTIQKIKDFLLVLKGESNQVQNQDTNIEVSTSNVNTINDDYSQKGDLFCCKICFEDECEMENVRCFTLLNNLKDSITILETNPKDVLAQDSELFIKENGFEFSFFTELSYDQIFDKVNNTTYLKSIDLKKSESKFYQANIFFEDGCEMENIRAFTVVKNLGSSCQNVVTIPENLIDESSIDNIRTDGVIIKFSSFKTYDQLFEELSNTVYLKSLKLEEISDYTKSEQKQITQEISKSNNNKKTEEKTKKSDSKKNAPTQQMISVNIGKLDQLLNLMGELVISEAMTTQNPDLDGLDLENFNKSARQLRKIIKDVQDTVMSMRMVSLSTTFFKMNRIVRDMCKALGKNIELVVEGEETEVDKNIIEHISDPLMHIIRNSVDHGVELPDVRLQNGKEEKGTIKLEAKNSGGEVLIIVKDDGAGINKDKVMAKAKAAGILTKPEEEYTDREIYQFIFHAGLSTKEAVTNYSGRGVGMDVVISNIEAVGGSILVESDPGHGTTTILKIPLTLAIIEGMLISMGGANYTIPISSIQETFKAKKENIFTDPDGNEMITLRGEVYNVVRLYEFFGAKTDIKDIEDGVLIMLENEEKSLCLFVDELIGEQQVVVKTIPKYIKKVKGISGCTLLGNGDISLIIDVAGFFDN